MSTHRPELRLRLEPSIIDELEARAVASGLEPTAGKTGGAAAYVRQLIHERLGLAPAADPHQQQSKERRKMEVITVQNVYTRKIHNLCRDHYEGADIGDTQVQHTWHRGQCEICAPQTEADRHHDPIDGEPRSN